MINLLLDIVFILILLAITVNILKGVKDVGDEISEIPTRGRALIILPTKEPPETFNKLVEQLIKYTKDAELYIVYQGGKPPLNIESPPSNIKIEVLEGMEDNDYKGKIGNIVTILRRIDISRYRYLIIIDDDILIHPRWFTYLTSLAEYKDFSTGYRVYLPIKNRLGSILTSLWNLYTLDTIYNREERIVWGGSTCIKTEAVKTSTLMRLWRRAVSDDVPLTYLARCRKGIGFNENTLVPSPSLHTLKDAINFIIRQQRIVYVYNKTLWLKGVLIHLFINLITAIALVNLITIIYTGIHILSLIKLLGIVTVFLSYTLKNHFRLRRYQEIFGSDQMRYLNRLKLYNLLFTPLILILQLYLLLLSRGREILWRGRKYILPTMEELGYSECIKDVIDEQGSKTN